MKNVVVTPFVPRKDYRNDALNMDFYELTMANAIYMLGMKDVQLVFDCFFRKNPGPKGQEPGFSISAGQEQLTDFLLNYHFDEVACEYLLFKGMDPGFVEYLSTYKWRGTMYAMPEGTVAYPNEQMVRIKCDAIGAILIETFLLQTMNFNSLITTKATKIVRAANNSGGVMEFGGRRAQGASASLFGARAAILGGCTGTANCLAEIAFGQPVKAIGTIAHAWVELFPTEWEAFKALADVYPENVSLLIDTYSIFKSGVINTLKLDDYLIQKYPNDSNKRVKSVRIDSGDLAYESKKLRKIFDDAGKPYIKIVASNGLNEDTIRSMREEEGAKIDSYGVGENLITASDCPVFGGVYKLVAVEKDGNWEPRMKCSDTLEKAIIPGYKMVYRLYDDDGRGYLDLIAMEDEVIEVGKPIKVYTTDLTDSRKEYTITPKIIKPLLVPYIVDGKLVRDMPSIQEIRDYIKDQLENKVWPEELRTRNPHRHYVDMTEKVYNIRSDMYDTLHGEN